jgi:hypothetical protein
MSPYTTPMAAIDSATIERLCSSSGPGWRRLLRREAG